MKYRNKWFRNPVRKCVRELRAQFYSQTLPNLLNEARYCTYLFTIYFNQLEYVYSFEMDAMHALLLNKTVDKSFLLVRKEMWLVKWNDWLELVFVSQLDSSLKRKKKSVKGKTKIGKDVPLCRIGIRTADCLVSGYYNLHVEIFLCRSLCQVSSWSFYMICEKIHKL